MKTPIARKLRVIFVTVMVLLLSVVISCSQPMPEDAVPTLEKNEKTGKWGFVYNKKAVIGHKYDAADEFFSSLARVGLDGKWGYVDKTGKEVIPLKYDAANNFSADLAKVGLNGKYGFIDKTGKEIIPLTYESIDDFKDDIARVVLGGKYGFISKTGKEIIPIKYDHIGHFKDGLAPARLDGKYGFINRDDETVIPFKYDAASDFAGGYAQVSLGDDSGKIDVNGAFTLQAKKITLQEAVKNKYVRFAARGSSIQQSYIDIENVTDMKLHLVIPAGTFLSAKSASYQNMVLTNPKDIVLEAGKKYSGNVSTACMNINRPIPDSNNTFGIAQHADKHLLPKVIKRLSEGNYKFSVIQAAVWIVTDGAGYHNMGTLRNQYGQRIISDEDYEKAVSIVNEARKME